MHKQHPVKSNNRDDFIQLYLDVKECDMIVMLSLWPTVDDFLKCIFFKRKVNLPILIILVFFLSMVPIWHVSIDMSLCLSNVIYTNALDIEIVDKSSVICLNEIRIFIPPPLGAGGIMFTVCQSPSVCPKPEIPSFHSYTVHPTNRVRVFCPSGEVSDHFPKNANELPAIWHADVSWPRSGLVRFWSWYVDFPPFGATLT